MVLNWASLAVVAICCLAGRILPHGLLLRLTLENERVTVEAFFDDDTPAAQAKVTLSSAAGITLLSGVTDERGRFTIPEKIADGSYRVIIDAGAGHRAEKPLTIPFGASAAVPEPTREEMTRTPWLKIGIGLAVLALFGLVIWRLPTRARIVNHDPNSSPRPTG